MYVTAIICSYIPNMIHQSYHHTPSNYIDRTKRITSHVINLSNTFTRNYAVNTHITLPFFALNMKVADLSLQ